MFERFRNRSDTRDDYVDENGGGVATGDTPRHERRRSGRGTPGGGGTGHARERSRRARAPARRVRRPQLGLRVLRLARGSRHRGDPAGDPERGRNGFGLSERQRGPRRRSNADTIGIVGGILLIAALVIAYYCGGYVSGRMSRFDGGRQGFGTWAIGLAVTIVLAVAGALFGAEYNVYEQLGLPRIPIDEGSLTAGAAIALAAVVILTPARRDGRRQGRRALPPQDRPARLQRTERPAPPAHGGARRSGGGRSGSL